MNRLTVIPALLLAACSAACSAPGESGEPAPKPSGETIACAFADPPAFDDECIVERQGEDVVVHHPDGSFRRFKLDPGGGGLMAADGAESSSQRIDGDWLILQIGPNSYRFPFTDSSRADG